MSTLVHGVLLIDDATHDVEEKLNALQQSSPKRHETLIGVCARLSLIDQIRGFSFVGSTQFETRNFLYQIDRLSAYLTTTCIDVLTNEHYQPYHLWLEESHKDGSLGNTWNRAVNELSQSLTPDKTASAFVKWTKDLFNKEYNETTSIRKAFKNFVSARDGWLKNWLLQNYIVEKLNSNFAPKKSWQVMGDEQKCRNIAHYLYDLRNLYTHTVIPYQPLDSVQRNISSIPDKYRPKGFVAIFFPSTNNSETYTRISLPEDKRESDVIRLLIITWIRMHWLEITTDSESFIQKYWGSRTTS